MKIALLAATAFLVGSPNQGAQPVPPPPAETSEVPFSATAHIFLDMPACIARLREIVRTSAAPAYDAAVGPYQVAEDDTRAHRVKARDWGHEIEEFRCHRAVLASRRWTHSMSDVKPFTVEDIGKMRFPEG